MYHLFRNNSCKGTEIGKKTWIFWILLSKKSFILPNGGLAPKPGKCKTITEKGPAEQIAYFFISEKKAFHIATPKRQEPVITFK
jgi:hypothetical protein